MYINPYLISRYLNIMTFEEMLIPSPLTYVLMWVKGWGLWFNRGGGGYRSDWLKWAAPVDQDVDRSRSLSDNLDIIAKLH